MGVACKFCAINPVQALLDANSSVCAVLLLCADISVILLCALAVLVLLLCCAVPCCVLLLPAWQAGV
jgi:hypothetical protein